MALSRRLGFVVLLSNSIMAWSWNADGHRLIAQMAINRLNVSAYERFETYNRALPLRGAKTLMNAAPWLDTLRGKKQRALFSKMHYIDLPFSTDASRLDVLNMKQMNAVLAINAAREMLITSNSTYEKAMALRVLLHVVGDLHQPLHAATRVSQQYPQGDRGGNLTLLPRNSVAHNLHAYWDRGAGMLVLKRNMSQLKKEAKALDKTFPCSLEKMDLNPMHWAVESHQLAIHDAYVFQTQNFEQYEKNARHVVEARLALAGCRLAAMLNDIDRKSVPSSRA
jgi:hypothetical protein